MRIWSIHPKYLDVKGLVALWRETLLAKHVLEGKTKGYTNHPQLNRFKTLEQPAKAIHQYLESVFEEAQARGYRFDESKFERGEQKVVLPVTAGQVRYEFDHLLRKLNDRDPERMEKLKDLSEVELHPLFEMVPGAIESWEVIL